MLEKGIAYKKTQVVNWDPVDQTVLANEQVIDGRGWRTGALVEKREIPGYYLGITQYADELLAALDTLPGWPERVKTMQANWIGKSYGVRFAFPYELRRQAAIMLWVFTTRADTIMGVTFCAVAAEHPLATRAAQDNPEARRLHRGMQARLGDGSRHGDHGKEGHADRHLRRRIRSPANKVEVWVGNYVLMSYGEGAVMAVPAHDERDFAFAKKYGLPIKQVIAVAGQDLLARRLAGVVRRQAERRLRQLRQVRRPRLRSRPSTPSPPTSKAKDLGDKQVQWRLRDWGISRQRYWGCPIPLIHCDSLRHRAGARRPAAGGAARGLRAGRFRQSAAQARRFPELHLPEVRQAGAARDRHHGHLRRFVLVLRALLPAAGKTDAMVDERDQLLDAGRPVHRRHRARHPAPALFALLDQGDARPRPGQLRRALRQPADAGHGAEPHLLAPHRQGRHRVLRARGSRTGARRRRPRHRRHARRPTASRSTTAASAPCRSRSATASIRRR